MAERIGGWRIAQHSAWGVILVFSAATLYSVARFYWRFWMNGREVASNLLILGHVSLAIPCLLLGPFLLIPQFRKSYPHVHRAMGKTYVVGVLISAVLGFTLALGNKYGYVARAGFASLGVVWFVTTFAAYRAIRMRSFAAHRRWMIRSYAISLAAVTVRFIETPPEGMTLAQWYPIMTWACWVPQLTLAEIYVRVTDASGRLLRTQIH